MCLDRNMKGSQDVKFETHFKNNVVEAPACQCYAAACAPPRRHAALFLSKSFPVIHLECDAFNIPSNSIDFNEVRY